MKAIALLILAFAALALVVAGPMLGAVALALLAAVLPALIDAHMLARPRAYAGAAAAARTDTIRHIGLALLLLAFLVTAGAAWLAAALVANPI